MSSSSNTNSQSDIDIEEGQSHLSLSTTSTSNDVDQAVSTTDTDQSNQPNGIVGLEQVDEDDTAGLPLPMGMAEMISNAVEPLEQTGKVEQIDDDDVGPEPPTVMLEASLNAADPQIASKLTPTISNNLASVNELSPPVPFNSAEFEQDTIAKNKAKDEMNRQLAAVSNGEDEAVVLTPSDEASIYEPPREVIEGREGMSDNTNTGRGGTTNRRGWDDIESRAARRDIESQARTNNHEDTADSIDNDSMAEANVEVPTPTNQEGLPEVEAYLVEEVEEEVYIATPTLPWWKQRRTKILLAAVLLTVSTLAIALGVLLSRPSSTTVNMIVNSTIAPSVSLAPSSSSAPSSSPTECVNKIISNVQDIDLQKDLQFEETNDLLYPKVAVDGRNMVVVALDGKYADNFQYDGPVIVTFYSLDSEDKWQRERPIRVYNMGTGNNLSRIHSVALSGTTAFVGFPSSNAGTGDIIVYEQDRFGWVRVDNVLTATKTGFFGQNICLSGNLAYVEDLQNTFLYHRKDNGKWMQLDTIDNGLETVDCSISGDSIAVYSQGFVQLYNYDEEQNEVNPTLEPIATKSVSFIELSNDYLLYWDKDGVFIYYRNDMNKTSSLLQQLNVTIPSDYRLGPKNVNLMVLDNDILVVRGYNRTHIYSLQAGSWVESITLDESYDNYQLSGRTLLVTKYNYTSLTGEISSINIQDCTQDMPTQSPSLSFVPTTSLSLSPTTRFSCFDESNGGRNGILYNSVRAYVDQDCANNEECEIGQVYGWPMNLWCVGNVKSMEGLFQGMYTFNEDISDWDTSSVTNMNAMLWSATAFNGDISSFDTSRVTDMTGMFAGASLFDIDVSGWNTTSVKYINDMFKGAASFNQDVSTFDISSVTGMGSMFEGAASFNQDLCRWQDTFPYNEVVDIFLGSGCTYQDTPTQAQKGPFCASNCT